MLNINLTISEQEAIVLGVIQEYLDRNQILDMEKVISHIKYYISKKRLNLNDNGIRFIIKNLIHF